MNLASRLVNFARPSAVVVSDEVGEQLRAEAGDGLQDLCGVQPELRRFDLERIFLSEIAQLLDVGVPVERVVVDRELRVERPDLALGGDDQRVDLAEHRVALDEAAVELADDVEQLLLFVRVVDPGPVDQAARLVGLVALERVDVETRKRVRVLLGDLLDLDPALGRKHEQRLLRAAVEGDREVVLLVDLRGLLDPELAHDVAVDVEAENLLGLALGIVGVVRELHSARLAAPAGQHLRLDDDLAAELLGGGPRLGRGRREPAFGDGDSEAPEQLLALVLVEIHGGGC